MFSIYDITASVASIILCNICVSVEDNGSLQLLRNLELSLRLPIKSNGKDKDKLLLLCRVLFSYSITLIDTKFKTILYCKVATGKA